MFHFHLTDTKELLDAYCDEACWFGQPDVNVDVLKERLDRLEVAKQSLTELITKLKRNM